MLSAIPERTQNHMKTRKHGNTETRELVKYSEPGNPNLRDEIYFYSYIRLTLDPLFLVIS